MICQKCGLQNKDTAQFCAACGAKLPEPAVTYVAPPAPTTPPANMMPVQNQKSGGKKGLIITLCIVLSVLIVGGGVGGYFIYDNNQKAAVQEQIDREAATAVSNLIASIGNVSLASGDAIVSARAQYDALTDDQQVYVQNATDLIKAEAVYKQLQDQKAAEEKAAADAAAKEKAEQDRIAAEAKAKEEAAKRTLVVPSYSSYYGAYQVNTPGSTLVMRYGPSTDYAKILSIPHGTYISVYGQSGEWAYVSYNHKNGWVNTNYLY
ncbi:MAG: zinc-ribbon domain-containing protein [Clostridia bacterium]|nr:zinc-ribbon domain-containing protein [Clostridia bacterium]